MSHTSPSGRGVLTPLAKLVIEAALAAELEVHLAGQPADDRARGQRNSRNGTRAKTVRTAVGPVTIEVPRDRWGTYDPLTVGKWQRDVIGIDRLLPLLAARDVPAAELVGLLGRAYPIETPARTLSLIGTTVRTQLRPWHQRAVCDPFPDLHVHLHTARRRLAAGPARAVVSVVGSSAPEDGGEQRRELLSLSSVTMPPSRQAWSDVAADLYRRRLRGVRSVEGAAAEPFREAAAAYWPVLGSCMDERALSA